jgi:hypothetical protein
MKTESLLLSAILAMVGLIALYRRSLFSDLQHGMNRYVNDKDQFIGIHTFFLRIFGIALIIAAIVVLFRG